jgi:hypothetical protein
LYTSITECTQSLFLGIFISPALLYTLMCYNCTYSPLEPKYHRHMFPADAAHTISFSLILFHIPRWASSWVQATVKNVPDEREC